jgi:hypothetical protein
LTYTTGAVFADVGTVSGAMSDGTGRSVSAVGSYHLDIRTVVSSGSHHMMGAPRAFSPAWPDPAAGTG